MIGEPPSYGAVHVITEYPSITVVSTLVGVSGVVAHLITTS